MHHNVSANTFSYIFTHAVLRKPLNQPILIESKEYLEGLEACIQKDLREGRLDEKYTAGQTALALAADLGLEKTIEQLIASKADQNIPNNSGMTPEDRAILQGHASVIKIFAKSQKQTALNYIALQIHKEGAKAVFKSLLKSGDVPDFKTIEALGLMTTIKLLGFKRLVKIIWIELQNSTFRVEGAKNSSSSITEAPPAYESPGTRPKPRRLVHKSATNSSIPEDWEWGAKADPVVFPKPTVETGSRGINTTKKI